MKWYNSTERILEIENIVHFEMKHIWIIVLLFCCCINLHRSRLYYLRNIDIVERFTIIQLNYDGSKDRALYH